MASLLQPILKVSTGYNLVNVNESSSALLRSKLKDLGNKWSGSSLYRLEKGKSFQRFDSKGNNSGTDTFLTGREDMNVRTVDRSFCRTNCPLGLLMSEQT